MVTYFVRYSVHELCIVSVSVDVLQGLLLSVSHDLHVTMYKSCSADVLCMSWLDYMAFCCVKCCLCVLLGRRMCLLSCVYY